MSISTKTGDGGETSLYDGSRISKASRKINIEHAHKALSKLTGFKIKNSLDFGDDEQYILDLVKENSGKTVKELHSMLEDKFSYRTFHRKIDELKKVPEITKSITNQARALAKEEARLVVLRKTLEVKETNLRELDTSEEMEHDKKLIYPDPPGSIANGMDGFFMIERHEHKFEYAGNPFTRVDVQCEGITHPGVGNLFRVVQVPGGFVRDLFGGIKKEEVKTAFLQASMNVHAILCGPYDEFTETNSDPEAGVYEGIYSTLHYGITPKATITVYAEKRHHPEFAEKIKLIREEMYALQKDIDEKEQDVGNIKSEIERLKQQLFEVSSDIDKYLDEQETKKEKLETKLRAIQCFLPDVREQASQKKKEVESLQQRFRSVLFLLGCIDVAQVFNIPEESLDAFQEQYTRFYGSPLSMIRRSDLALSSEVASRSASQGLRRAIARRFRRVL